MSKPNYILRMEQLIELGTQKSELCKIIHNEYGIHVNMNKVDKLISNNRGNINDHDYKTLLKRKLSWIKKSLASDNYSPKKAKEISKFIKVNYDAYISKSQINKLIHHNLRDEVVRDDVMFAYYLSNFGKEIKKKDNNFKEKYVECAINILKKQNRPMVCEHLFYEIKKNFNNKCNLNVNELISLCKKRSEIEYISYLNIFLLVKSNQNNSSVKNISSSIKKLNYEDFLNTFRNGVKDDLINVLTGNRALDDLLKVVVKDNYITESERNFLISKAEEYKYDKDLIKNAENALNSNNPFLDNTLESIFEDGEIESNELKFIKEKQVEYGYTKEFVSKRFWIVGISKYFELLLENKLFENIVKLWFLYYFINSNSYKSRVWLYSKLNIYTSNSFDVILNKGTNFMEKDISTSIINKYGIEPSILINKCKNARIELNNKINPQYKNGHINIIFDLINEEKYRIGTPDAHLFSENLIYKIKDIYGIN